MCQNITQIFFWLTTELHKKPCIINFMVQTQILGLVGFLGFLNFLQTCFCQTLPIQSVASFQFQMDVRLWEDRNIPVSCSSFGNDFEPRLSVSFCASNNSQQFQNDGFAVSQSNDVYIATITGAQALQTVANKTIYILSSGFSVVSSCFQATNNINQNIVSYSYAIGCLSNSSLPSSVFIQGQHTFDLLTSQMYFFHSYSADFSIIPNFVIKPQPSAQNFWDAYKTTIIVLAVTAIILLILPVAALVILVKLRTSKLRYSPINLN